MNCDYCNNPIPVNVKFCPSCGAPVENQTDIVERSAMHDRSEYQTAYNRDPNPIVSFPDAIVMFFTRWSDYSTRSRRSEYWWTVLLTSLMNSVVSGIFPEGSIIVRLVELVLFVPSIALTVRRLHDVGKPGTYYLWNLLPVAGQIIVLLQMLKDSAPDNQWGPNPKYTKF